MAAHQLRCQIRIPVIQGFQDVPVVLHRGFSQHIPVKIVVLDPLYMEEEHVGKFHDVFVIHCPQDHFVEFVVTVNGLFRLIRPARLLKTHLYFLHARQLCLCQSGSSQACGQALYFRQGAVAFFNIILIHAGHRSGAARSHLDQLLGLQHLKRFAHRSPAHVKIGCQLRVQQLLTGHHLAADDPVTQGFVYQILCRFALKGAVFFRYGQGSSSLSVPFVFHRCVRYI